MHVYDIIVTSCDAKEVCGPESTFTESLQGNDPGTTACPPCAG